MDWDEQKHDYLLDNEERYLEITTETHIIRGVAHWAKVLGAPRLNQFTGNKEHSIDVTPDAEGRKLMKKIGLADRLREPKDGDTRTESFISFRHNELRKDGTKNDPIRIVAADNSPWGNDLIGNESLVDAKFVVKDYGPGKKKGMYLRAIRVLEHVPYVVQDFAPLSEDDKYFAGETEDQTVPVVSGQLPEGMEPELDDDYPE